jgi:hypothetical protein
MEMVFEANEVLMLTPFEKHYRNNDDQEYEVYEIINYSLTRPSLETPLQKFYLEYSNRKYGYTQLLWFIYRWVMETLGIEIKLNKKRKYFVKGIVCSELVYLYLKSLNIPELNEDLDNYQPNTITPEDLRKIVLKHKNIFRLVEQKESL